MKRDVWDQIALGLHIGITLAFFEACIIVVTFAAVWPD